MNGMNTIDWLIPCRDCLMKLSHPPSLHTLPLSHCFSTLKSHRVPSVVQSDSAGMDTLIDDLKAAPDPETLTLKGASMLHGLEITFY